MGCQGFSASFFPPKNCRGQAFLHMGTAPMTAVLADFLTKLGWSGICVGPMKPPPGNEAGNWGHLVMVELVEPHRCWS